MKRSATYTVFISHASADEWTAKQIETHIRRLGADTCLYTLDVTGGDDFGSWMRESMGAADECIVLYTPEAAKSRNVWVEVGGAWMQKKRVVLVLCRLRVTDVSRDVRFPAYLKTLDFRDLNTEFDSRYLPELADRVRARAEVA